MTVRRIGAMLAILGLAMVLGFLAASTVRSAEQSGGEAAKPEAPTYMSQYTGADAEKIGTAKCIMCHQKVAPQSATSHFALLDKKEGSPFKDYGCEACHGPGSKHNGNVKAILDPKKMNQTEVTDFCTKCHVKKGTMDKAPWIASKHFVTAKLTCLTCHSGHSEFANSLVKENVVDICSTCHTAECQAFAAGTHNNADPKTMTCVMCHNPHNVGAAEAAPAK